MVAMSLPLLHVNSFTGRIGTWHLLTLHARCPVTLRPLFGLQTGFASPRCFLCTQQLDPSGLVRSNPLVGCPANESDHQARVVHL
jgi:hypothetical protein